MSTPALFLDRDGVINVDHGYVGQRDRFEFVEGIFELCRYAVDHGLLTIVITNQAGIARGYYSEADFVVLTDWMRVEFASKGAPIAAVYHCPFHPDGTVERYRGHSDWRKPQPGMIMQAMSDHDIDLKRSILVGDKESDIEAGIAAGVGCNILLSQSGDRHPTKAHRVVRSLGEAQAVLARSIALAGRDEALASTMPHQ